MSTKISLRDMSLMLNISKHTLRYYDKIGLIEPSFDHNGYRYYNLDHYYALSTIKILREMNVPIKDIKKSFSDDNLDDFTELLRKSKDKIDLEIKKMKRVSQILEEKLNTAAHDKKYENKWFVKEFPKRKFIHIGVLDFNSGDGIHHFRNIVDKYKIDILLKNSLMAKYNRGHLEELVNDVVDFYVEYEDETKKDEEVDTIPKGTYAVYYYKGKEDNLRDALGSVMEDIQSQGYRVKGEFYEFLRPSHIITSSKMNFFTEFNILIAKK